MRLKRRSKQHGFSIIELLVAMLVLMAGVLGGMTMIIIGMTRNSSNRVDTTGTNVAQTVLEEISAVPANANQTFNITDCVNTTQSTSTLTVTTAAGGATLTSSGDIDYNADNPSTLNKNNYQINYTVCSPGQQPTVFDVRWNITTVGAGGFGKLVTISARQPVVVTRTGFSWLPPVTLRTIVGM